MSRFRAPARLSLALLAALAMLAVACEDPQSTVNPKSDVAQSVQDVYFFVTILAIVIFAIVLIAVVFFSIYYREGAGRPAKQIHGNNRLEVIWTLIPVGILVAIAVPTMSAIADIRGDPPDGALEIVATGHQWWFEFEYPEEGFTTANEIHIPVDRAANIRLLSNDVIHSFWVPQLTGKTDMVPGHENSLWFTPNETGEYLAQCAEFCGTSHANMRFRVFVDTQADYDAWVANQQADAREPTSEEIAAGRDEFVGGACIGCHAVRGTIAQARVGPELTHLAERTTLASGMFANDAENLERWLRNPPEVKPGSKMPNLNLTDEQIERLVTYLQSLD